MTRGFRTTVPMRVVEHGLTERFGRTHECVERDRVAKAIGVRPGKVEHIAVVPWVLSRIVGTSRCGLHNRNDAWECTKAIRSGEGTPNAPWAPQPYPGYPTVCVPMELEPLQKGPE
jgi:hypothetical protein